MGVDIIAMPIKPIYDDAGTTLSSERKSVTLVK